MNVFKRRKEDLKWVYLKFFLFLDAFGIDHPHVSYPYKNMGLVWQNKGEFGKALECYQKSLEIRLKNFGFQSIGLITLIIVISRLVLEI